jgi:hypothetical protein
MDHIPTTESDIQKVIRIAKVLDISIEDAAVTCDAFHLAFSDDGMRWAIFEIIDELDRSAARKGEPMGLMINYTVELGLEGIRVGRYADEIPAGEVVELTPSHRANVLLRIVDNFPTQEFLGPLIVNRPGWHFDTFDPNDPDLEMPEEFSDLESNKGVICLGPIRLTLNDRFQFLSEPASKAQLDFFLRSADPTALARPLLASASSHPGQPTSGLSPPTGVGESGTLRFERCPPAFAIDVETFVSHLDL